MVSLLIKKFAPESMDKAKRRTRCGFICGAMGIFLNLLLFVLKLICGIISGAVSITADAFNNLSDAASSVATLMGFFLSGREADSDHPFGHGRIEYISGIMISFIISFMGLELFKSSFSKILSPQKTLFNKWVVIILLFSVIIKLYMAFYNAKIGKSIDSAAIKAAASDSLSDCISTGAVLVSLIIMHLTSVNIDGYVGSVVSLLILRAGIKAVIDTSSPLLGNPPDKEFVSQIEKILMECPETVGMHDLVVHDYGPNKRFISVHMEVDGSKNLFALHDAVDLAERHISTELNCEAVIHMDPIDMNNPLLSEIFEKVSERARELCSGLSVHDMRIVPGTTHTNIIFDLVIPASLFKNKDFYASELTKTVSEIDENYFAVITSEISYC